MQNKLATVRTHSKWNVHQFGTVVISGWISLVSALYTVRAPKRYYKIKRHASIAGCKKKSAFAVERFLGISGEAPETCRALIKYGSDKARENCSPHWQKESASYPRSA